MRSIAAILVVVSTFAGLRPSVSPLAAMEAQRTDAVALLNKVRDYAQRYLDVFSNVVADEHFVQKVSGRSGPSLRRDLRSELALVAVAAPLGWRPFRDVYEVDDKPVRERDSRLQALFSGTSSGSDALVESARIAEESSRYNIGPVARTVNVPGLPLLFLVGSLGERFDVAVDKRDGNRWVVKFTERVRPTLFRGNGDSDNPSSGRFWVDPATGAIFQCEHNLVQFALAGKFVTFFEWSDRFKIAVPVRLVEEATVTDGAHRLVSRVEGTADYGEFKAFNVAVDTSVKQPAGALPR